MATQRFKDRRDAGRHLATALGRYAERDDVVVLGLAPGGVPVGFEIAEAFESWLDAFIVQTFNAPDSDEHVLGAVVTGGVRVIDHHLAAGLSLSDEGLEAIAAPARAELVRLEHAYRGDRPPPAVGGRTVILVDDGVAKPMTMAVAIAAVRADVPARLIAAVPVADAEACDTLESLADEVVCLHRARPLTAVGDWYEDFTPPGEDEVRPLLEQSRRPPPADPEAFAIRQLTGSAAEHDGLIAEAAKAKVVCIGEASHGTHDFYRERAEITRRLIDEAGFTAVAVEADWPDAHRVNRYVRGAGNDEDAEEALSDFRRFPVWMWRNADVAQFVGWLRERNDGVGEDRGKTGFYGLDLYSLHKSMEEVVSFLESVDPEAAQRARDRYSCFDHFGSDPQVYAYEAGLGGAEPCEKQAIEQLLELQRMAVESADEGGREDEDQRFFAEQNARLVADAEEYYRASFRGGITSWNLRDQHMVGTLEALVDHLERTRGPAKVVVWAHNSHLGDARATELGDAGELNVGQLVRERYGEDNTLLVGFTTYEGEVTAASTWGAEAERKRVRRGLPGSWEERFHETGVEHFLLETRAMAGRRLERAIGVIYVPQTERRSHYFHATIGDQFDVIIHIDRTTAVEPLETTSTWQAGELPETYPFGV
jgi:erythromycin esterase-like protein/predicted phosphoribosyltransferase